MVKNSSVNHLGYTLVIYSSYPFGVFDHEVPQW